MVATPHPMIAPPTSSGQVRARLKPTMNTPIPTTITASSMEKMVTGTLYRMVWPGMVNPSMATKCITQMPVVAMARAATVSQRARAAPCTARARVVQRSPAKQPTHDTTYARSGFSAP